MKQHSAVVILDFGSQYTQLIARRIRELGVFSTLLPAEASVEAIQKLNPKAIILSGGPCSVYDDEAPQLTSSFFEFQKQTQIPVLGICYGMQLLAHELGGQVAPASICEYGRADIRWEASTLMSLHAAQSVWMSHGDEVIQAPSGFAITARSGSQLAAAMENPSRKIYGLQFHPEVSHTQFGKEILEQFLFGICRISADWNMSSILEDQLEKVKAQVGPDQHVICALSGGVDSAVAATLVHRAIGDRLHCFFVDHGLLRLNEREQVLRMFQEELHLPVECLDHSERFLSRLAGVSDPEQKRKIIGTEFIRSFEIAASELAKRLGTSPSFLVQGTLYPDVIESSPVEAASSQTSSSKKQKWSKTIKSHHNVGGLPKDLKFQLIEPLRDLFKDEVRRLGKVLGVNDSFLKRHPFPGPGLAVRIMGEVTPEALHILRQVDHLFIEELKKSNLYDQIWQAFSVFLPIRSVGVQGDGRTHDHVVALRAVTSSDGMTADWYPFDARFLQHVSAMICNQVKGVNRVVYDVSSKPPATIEWE